MPTKQPPPRVRAAHHPMGPPPSARSAPPAAPSKAQEASLLSLMESADVDDRSGACVAFASMLEPNIADDDEVAKSKAAQLARLMKKGLIAKLIRRAVDAEPVVRLNAIGALRNACATGGDEALAELQRGDAWTAVQHALTEALGKPSDECSAAIAAQCLALMDALCLNIPVVCERRAPGATPILTTCLKLAHLAESTVKVLCSAVDGNPAMANALLASPETLAALGQVAQGPCTCAKLYALGAMLGVCLCRPDQQGLEGPVALFIAALQEVHAPSELPQSRLDDGIVNDALALERAEASDASAAVESDSLARWMDRVNVQTVAFEVLGNFVRAGEMDPDILVNTQVAYSRAIGLLLASSCLDATVAYATCAFSPDAALCLRLPVAHLQLRASEAAQALLANPAWAEAVTESAWTAVGSAVSSFFRQSPPAGALDVYEQRKRAVTSLLGAMAKTTTGLPFAEDDAESLLSLAPVESSSEATRALLTSVVAAAGQVNASAARPLLRVMSQDPSILVICEAVDGLIDIFSLEDRHPLFVSLGAPAALHKFAKDPRLRKLQNLDEADAQRIEQVAENVAAFIEWKRGQ